MGGGGVGGCVLQHFTGGMGECHTEYGEEQWRTQIHIFIVADRQV